MITIRIEVKSDQGRFYPGVASVSINGRRRAKLRGEEWFEIVVPDPTFSTSVGANPTTTTEET